MIKFSVPGQPVGKGRPKASRIGGGVRMYTPKKTASYEELIRQSAKQVIGNEFNPYLGQIAVKLDLYYKIPSSKSRKWSLDAVNGIIRPTTKPDLDNCSKAILDALNGIAYKDDSQVVELIVNKYYGKEPKVDVCIKEMGL